MSRLRTGNGQPKQAQESVSLLRVVGSAGDRSHRRGRRCEERRTRDELKCRGDAEAWASVGKR